MATSSSNRFMEKLKRCPVALPLTSHHADSQLSYSQDETFSDAVIRTEDTDFKVHRVILSCHSEYFAKQLDGPWKESSERVIVIKDFDTTVVQAMIHFMYHFEYMNSSGVSAMVFDAQVYQIADKYGFSALKEYAKSKFGTAIKTGWSMDDFAVSIDIVYTTTPLEDRGLRDLLVETATLNLDELVAKDGFCQALRTTADFAADLVPFTCSKPVEGLLRYECPDCRQTFEIHNPGNETRYCPRCGIVHSGWNEYRYP
ncbi:hypothetical protein FGRMN_10028 [Fusarium graminum]|nr:hypothetical protein FGRMN_10028 [Fusarium graminum]